MLQPLLTSGNGILVVLHNCLWLCGILNDDVMSCKLATRLLSVVVLYVACYMMYALHWDIVQLNDGWVWVTKHLLNFKTWFDWMLFCHVRNEQSTDFWRIYRLFSFCQILFVWMCVCVTIFFGSFTLCLPFCAFVQCDIFYHCNQSADTLSLRSPLIFLVIFCNQIPLFLCSLIHTVCVQLCVCRFSVWTAVTETYITDWWSTCSCPSKCGCLPVPVHMCKQEVQYGSPVAHCSAFHQLSLGGFSTALMSLLYLCYSSTTGYHRLRTLYLEEIHCKVTPRRKRRMGW